MLSRFITASKQEITSRWSKPQHPVLQQFAYCHLIAGLEMLNTERLGVGGVSATSLNLGWQKAQR